MIEIVPSQHGDAALMAAIHADAVPYPWNEEAFASLTDRLNGISVIGHLGGRPQGFAVAQFAADEAELLQIATSPAARGKGLARAMIVSISEQLALKGAKEVFLEVAESNSPARALYEALGFAEFGRRGNYYPCADNQAEDALLLRLNLVEMGARLR